MKYRINNKTIFVISPTIQFIVYMLIGFLFLFICRSALQPYKQTLASFTNSKGALLEIISTIPFVFTYLTIIYFVFNAITRIKEIEFNEENLIFKGTIKTILNKRSIKKIYFFENLINENTYRIVFATENNKYSLNFMEKKIVNKIRDYFELSESMRIYSEKKNEQKKIYKL